MARYQEPYVEDYNSELSEAIPLTRRQTTKRASGLSNSMSADTSSYEAEGASVSDSGYSSHAEASTPTETPPPQKAATPAPPPRTQTQSRPSRSPSNPVPPPFTRSSSKSFSRTQSPAVPRNIPSSYNTIRRELRESSPTTSTGGSEDCDCPDCGKTPSKPVTNSPSRNSGVWPVPEHSYHGSYSSSPSSYATYQYPSKYDGYSEGAPAHVPYTEPSREGGSSRRERSSTQSSMPPPPRPLSTFAGSSAATSSHTPSGSWSQSSYATGYFGHTPSPAPAAPTPASTCPPSYSSSMYPPPPIDTSVHANSHSYDYSPYAPPSTSSSAYGHSYTPDPYSQSSVPPAPNYYQAPEPSYHSEPSYHTAQEYSSLPPPPQIMNRRNSMRAQANAGAAVLESSSDYPHPQVSHHRERRPSNRVHGGERPTSWYGQQQFQDIPSRSVSVPPAQTEPTPVTSSSRRMASTPQPTRRRDSSNSQGSSSHSSRLPSSLARSMETCAIDDEPPQRSSRHSHHRSSSYYEYHHGAVARRDTGTMMQNSHSNRSSDSGSSGHSYDSGREELVVLDSDEPFTMRYPAGVPVKVQLNGGHSPRTISLGRDKNENVEYSIAYKYVQQRQQQVHAQLQHGAVQMDHYDRRATSDYPHRSYERQRV